LPSLLCGLIGCSASEEWICKVRDETRAEIGKETCSTLGWEKAVEASSVSVLKVGLEKLGKKRGRKNHERLFEKSSQDRVERYLTGAVNCWWGRPATRRLLDQ